MIRAFILLCAAYWLVALWMDRPMPAAPSDGVPYCVIDERVAMKHPLTGEWIYGWGKGYGPCSLQDIFREI